MEERPRDGVRQRGRRPRHLALSGTTIVVCLDISPFDAAEAHLSHGVSFVRFHTFPFLRGWQCAHEQLWRPSLLGSSLRQRRGSTPPFRHNKLPPEPHPVRPSHRSLKTSTRSSPIANRWT